MTEVILGDAQCSGSAYCGSGIGDGSLHFLRHCIPANSLIEVVQEAVDSTGMTDVPLEDRTKLLSDNGSGYVSRAFREYMRVMGIRHVLASPFHSQTNGKLERYHQTLKRDVNQLPYWPRGHIASRNHTARNLPDGSDVVY